MNTYWVLGLFAIAFAQGFENHAAEESMVQLSKTFKQLERLYVSTSQNRVNQPQQSVGCMVCEYLIAEVIYQLESNRTATEFFPWLEKQICSKLVQSNGLHKLTNSYCEQILDAVLKELVKLVDQKVQPVTVCTGIKVCTSASKRRSKSKYLVL